MNTPLDIKPLAHKERLSRALASLDGLSVGDALGEMLSVCSRNARQAIEQGRLPGPHWWHTDDTQMAMAVVEELSCHRGIAPDSLARRFVRRYQADPGRGYGRGARLQLEQMAEGQPWQQTSVQAFNGGSKGNGGAMRAGPLGAYYADDIPSLIEHGTRSAQITHMHPEGISGALAVALACAGVETFRSNDLDRVRSLTWTLILQNTPRGETREGLLKAAAIPLEMDAEFAARILGSGFLVTAPDTVPYAIWCALKHLDSYPEAIITTLEGDGDCDTNCAIVGSIVATHSGRENIPSEWLAAREPLDLDLS